MIHALRFVKRFVKKGETVCQVSGVVYEDGETRNILQQLVSVLKSPTGEVIDEHWEDVPLVCEEGEKENDYVGPY